MQKISCKRDCVSGRILQENKKEIWLSPMTKAPTPTEMSKGQSDNTNNARQKFDYTVVADRLRTVIWCNYGHPTGVVNLVYGPNLPILRNTCNQKDTHLEIKSSSVISSQIGVMSDQLKVSLYMVMSQNLVVLLEPQCAMQGIFCRIKYPKCMSWAYA